MDFSNLPRQLEQSVEELQERHEFHAGQSMLDLNSCRAHG